jgi:hypothetical protein
MPARTALAHVMCCASEPPCSALGVLGQVGGFDGDNYMSSAERFDPRVGKCATPSTLLVAAFLFRESTRHENGHTSSTFDYLSSPVTPVSSWSPMLEACARPGSDAPPRRRPQVGEAARRDGSAARQPRLLRVRRGPVRARRCLPYPTLVAPPAPVVPCSAGLPRRACVPGPVRARAPAGAAVAVTRSVCQLALLPGASARSTGSETRRRRRQALTAAAARTAWRCMSRARGAGAPWPPCRPGARCQPRPVSVLGVLTGE